MNAILEAGYAINIYSFSDIYPFHPFMEPRRNPWTDHKLSEYECICKMVRQPRDNFFPTKCVSIIKQDEWKSYTGMIRFPYTFQCYKV